MPYYDIHAPKKRRMNSQPSIHKKILEREGRVPARAPLPERRAESGKRGSEKEKNENHTERGHLSRAIIYSKRMDEPDSPLPAREFLFFFIQHGLSTARRDRITLISLS
jgi:hypothetical protein